LTNSPLDWSINLLLLLVMELMPQECVVHGMRFGVHGGGQKMTLTALEKGIDLNLFYWSFY
jgi:hypothetical protein